MRNPSKNTIKRLVRQRIIEKESLINTEWSPKRLKLSLGFIQHHNAYTRIALVSKGKIVISSLKGCERYGYKPPFAKDSKTSEIFKKLILDNFRQFWKDGSWVDKMPQEHFGNPIWANEKTNFDLPYAKVFWAENFTRTSLDTLRERGGDLKAFEDRVRGKPLSVEDLIKSKGF